MATTQQYISCTLPNQQDDLVEVKISPLAAHALLKQCQQVFGWQIAITQKSELTPIITETIEEFAQHVIEAANLVLPAGRFSKNHVFINYVWRAWQNSGGQDTLLDFKLKLREAAEQKRIKLSCAALSQTLNAMDLLQSELIDTQDTTQHFVVLDDNSQN